MPDRTSPTAPRRAAAVIGLTALAVALTGSPAFAQDIPLPQLETVTDPISGLLSPSLSPSPSTSPEPLPVPVPEPLAPVVDPVVEAVTGSAPQEEPVAQQGSAPQPVAAPGTGTAPRTTTAKGSAPGAASVGGVGSASLGALRGVGGLRAGMGTTDVPALGAPMIAAAPSFTLPGLPVPETAPIVEVAASRPSSSPVTPAGLPALVVAVAAVVLVAAGAGQAAEMRVRRAAAGTD